MELLPKRYKAPQLNACGGRVPKKNFWSGFSRTQYAFLGISILLVIGVLLFQSYYNRPDQIAKRVESKFPYKSLLQDIIRNPSTTYLVSIGIQSNATSKEAYLQAVSRYGSIIDQSGSTLSLNATGSAILTIADWPATEEVDPGIRRSIPLQSKTSGSFEVDSGVTPVFGKAIRPESKVAPLILRSKPTLRWESPSFQEKFPYKKFLQQLEDNPDEMFQVTVVFQSDINPSEAAREAAQAGSIISSVFPSYFVEGKASEILKLSNSSDIEAVDSAFHNSIQTNINALPAIGADLLDYLGNSGSGINVEISDSGYPWNGTDTHPDIPLPNATASFCRNDPTANSTDGNGHGTGTAGIALGRGKKDVRYRGVANGSYYIAFKFVNCPFGIDDQNLSRLFVAAAGNNSAVSINSWEVDNSNGVYDLFANKIDNAVNGTYANSTGGPNYLTVIVASGNDNDFTASPATCKNCISVGASVTGNWDNVSHSIPPSNCPFYIDPPANRACFSNYGPVNSRVKPDLLAPGAVIVTTDAWYLSGNYYTTQGAAGTSASAPYVAGLAAILMEDDATYKYWPELVKARLINTAIALPGISTNLQGRGHVNGYGARYGQSGIFVTTLSVGNYTNSTLATSQNYSFSVNPSNNPKELKLTLVYTDDPGNNGNIVQNLSLRLYYPNSTLAAQDVSPDTVRQISLANPSTGTYNVEVLYSGGTGVSVKYGLMGSYRQVDPALSLSQQSNSSTVSNGQSFTLTTNLSNGGFTTVGSYIDVKLPTEIVFSGGANITRSDGVVFNVPSSMLFYNSTTGFYRLALGEVINGYPRKAEWFLQANSASNKTVVIQLRYGAMNFDPASVNATIALNGLPWKSGWNLVAFPSLPSNTSVSSVLSSISGSYSKVQTYAPDQGKWLTYDVSVPGWAQSLANVESQRGYYLLMSQDAGYVPSGSSPSSVTWQLKQGWNVVGYPLVGKPVETALSSIAGKYQKVQSYDSASGLWRTYDASAPSWAQTLSTLDAGMGYFLLANQDVNVTLS